MDDHLSTLQIWTAEKALIQYINELNSFAVLFSGDFDDSDHEDMKILAMDIDNALTLRSDSLHLGLSDENEHTTPDQVRAFINAVHDHIIINQDINFATVIVESDPRLATVLDFLLKHPPTPKKPCHSAIIIDTMKDSIYTSHYGTQQTIRLLKKPWRNKGFRAQRAGLDRIRKSVYGQGLICLYERTAKRGVWNNS